jgi:hypothetical protein
VGRFHYPDLLEAAAMTVGSTTDLKALKRRLMRAYPHVPKLNQQPTAIAWITALLSTLNQSSDIQSPLLERLATASSEDFDELCLDKLTYALLAWVDDTFRTTLKTYPLDGHLAAQLQTLLPLVAAVAISEEEFLAIGEHPLQRLLDSICVSAIGWNRSLGKTGQPLLEKIQQCCEQSLEFFELQEHSFEDILNEFENFLHTEATNAERTRSRVIESETGRLKAASARLTAARELNQLMLDKHLPLAIVEFLQGTWFSSLQLILILQGPDSDEWSRAVRVTKALVQSVQPFDSTDDVHRKRLYKIIPKIPRELRALMVSLEDDSDAMQRALKDVEETHFQLLRDRPLSYHDYALIELEGAAARRRVSKHMLAQVEELQVGQWFVIRQDDGHSLRACLSLKLQEYDQLLFTNRAGARVLQKSFEDFAYLLSSGSAHALQPTNAFSQSLQRTAGLAQAGTDLPPANLTTVIAATPAPKPPERAVATPATKIEHSQRIIESDQPPEMAIGTWVVLSNDGQRRLCKLAAKMSDKDWYLFVNRKGKRDCELSSDSLKALVAAGEIEFVADVSRFEETVDTIVQDFRKLASEDPTP